MPYSTWETDPAHFWQMLFLYVFAYGYAFAFGAALASFLNVVVYRLPRRLNLVKPGSRCPKCATPIEARDNIPVLGWLALRGRCRICGAPIAARYLLIEIAIGLLFVLLLHLEVFWGGVNLPGRAIGARQGLTILVSSQTWELGRLALYHAILLSLLLVVALMEYDRQRVPTRLWVIMLLLGLLPPLVWPDLRPVAWRADTSGAFLFLPTDRGRAGAIFHGLVGVAAGSLFGAALSIALPPGRRAAAHRRQLVLAILTIGAYLGWQAAAQIALLAAFGMAIGTLSSRTLVPLRTWTPLCYVMGAAWLYVPCWKWFDLLLGPGDEREDVTAIITFGLVLLIALACRWLSQPNRTQWSDGVAEVPR